MRALRMAKTGSAYSRGRRGPQAPRRRRRHRARAVYERGYGGGPVRGRKWHERRDRKGKFRHAAAPRRRHRRHHARSPFARVNPVTWLDTAITFAVGSLGYVAASAADRLVATSPILTVGGQAKDGPLPGKPYNTEAVTAPMNLKRWGVAAAVIILPLAISGAPMFSGAKTSLRVFSAGAAIRTLGKAGDDLLAKFLGNGPTGQRLYAQEIKSHNGYLNAQASLPNALSLGNVHVWQSAGSANQGASGPDVPAATRNAGTGGLFGGGGILGLGAIRRIGAGARGCCEAGAKGLGCACASRAAMNAQAQQQQQNANQQQPAGAAGLPAASTPASAHVPAAQQPQTVASPGPLVNRWGLAPAQPRQEEDDAA